MKVNVRAKQMVYGTAAVLLLLSVMSTANAVGERPAANAAAERTITVWISSLESKDGKLVMKADPIAWYMGKDADKVFAEHDPEGAAEIGGAPDGYYIVNDDKTMEAYEVSPQAEVQMQLYHPDAIKWNEKISLQQFIRALDEKATFDQTGFPYHITLEDGKIVKIVQQYIP